MPHLLLAEDDVAVRAMCVRALRRAGFEVTETASGEEAIEQLRHQGFDLLLTDLKMPGMGGLATCRAVRERDDELPIVVMTGYGSMESAIEALKIGVSEFILKPFRPDELVNAVQRSLEKGWLKRENARLNALIPLFDLSRAFMSSVDLSAIPAQVIRIARQETQADRASLMLLTAEGDLIIQAADGLDADIVHHTRQPADYGVAGHVLAQREPAVLHGSLRDDPRFGDRVHSDVGSAICLRLLHQDRALGVLNVSREDAGRPFTRADVELLSLLASQAAVALENARLFNERERAYERLAELDTLKSEFINIASDELRAPLAVMLAYASLLEQQATDDMRDLLEQVVDSANQLKSIIDEMVSLRRIDRGDTQVQLDTVDLNEVVPLVVDEHRPIFQAKGINLQVSPSADLAATRADPQVLRLILNSLLSNAHKYTPQGGSVSVEMTQSNGMLTIAVHDTGVGIPPEEQERIFDRFYQVEHSFSREHGGMGLGLAIAQDMAELIDGRIRVESAVDQGSTFSLDLRAITD